MSGQRKPHHSGDYARRAAAIRQAAYLNPDTRCWRPDCQRTLAQHRTPWQAGHVIDGLAGGELRAECTPCNARHGAIRGNRMRGQGTTQQW